MNLFDLEIIIYLNKFAHVSRFFDSSMILITQNKVIKSLLLMAVFWWFWFHNSKDSTRNRNHIITTLIACFISLFLARALALLTPFRPRPLHNPSIDFHLPYGVSEGAYEFWSSFPSDHATLFFTLATGIFYISGKFGILAFLYVITVICLPRIYLGFHYPTDILAGALIGTLIAILANKQNMINKLSQPAMDLSEKYPGLFYTVFFVLSHQIVDMFEGVRDIGDFVIKIVF